MIQSAVARLEHLCNTIPALLSAIDEQEFSFKVREDRWSKKQILGHLIDSATNNHHRFVRGQFEDVPSISYDQNLWNKHSYYQEADTKQLIIFWEHYNRHLLMLINHLPEPLLGNRVRTGLQQHTLAFFIDDYVIHLEHHLKQLVSYS